MEASTTESTAKGPAWLGIGAQRCGTTWFVNLLVQHPMVTTPGAKELHALYMQLPSPWSDDDAENYRRLFQGNTRCGEFTPFYMRVPWCPEVATGVLRPDAPIYVLLRDPIDRYESSVRLGMPRLKPGGDAKAQRREVRVRGTDAVWAGMYASQLDLWEAAFGRERILVIQYEALRADPAGHMAQAWARLGLEPVGLTNVEKPSSSTRSDVEWTVDAIPGLRDTLRRLYAPQVEQLERWGIDRRLWTNFA